MRISAVIPAYNAGDRLHDVLLQIVRFIPAERVIVVNDGSTDGSLKSIGDLGVIVLNHAVNRGKGEALKTGFRCVIKYGWDAVFTIDGDGQHNPERIPAFLDTLTKQPADMVIGNRDFECGSMPVDRICSNGISSLITSFMTGRRVRDSQCGYRLIRSVILRSVRLRSARYETETEFLIRALWMGFSVAVCPIDTAYKGEPSHIRRGSDTLRFCKLMIRLLFERSGFASTGTQRTNTE